MNWSPYSAPEYMTGISNQEIWTFVYGSKTLSTLSVLQALNDQGRAKNIPFCSRTIWHIFIWTYETTRTALLIFTVGKSKWIDTRKYGQVNAFDSLYAFQQNTWVVEIWKTKYVKLVNLPSVLSSNISFHYYAWIILHKKD